MINQSRDIKVVKQRIIDAGYKAIDELIGIAGDRVLIKYEETDEELSKLSADKMKNAAAAKKTAIFDAFEILERIKLEEDSLLDNKAEGEEKDKKLGKHGFAEQRATTGKVVRDSS